MGKRQHCQSCDMPMHLDAEGGGTEKDGSRSSKYCSLCYANGEFHYKGTDVREYQKMIVDIMVENGWWRPMAWLMTRRIPKLERWAKS